jgi:tape measure domain-containing protein
VEERLDVVVDSSLAKKGIDVLTAAMNNLLAATRRTEAATTRLFDEMTSGLNKLESSLFSLKSILIAFTAVIGIFKQIGEEITRFQAFISAMSVSTGGVKEARVEFAFLMDMADRLGISINALSHNYSQMAAAATNSGMTMTQLRDIFESFSVAARVMHLSSQDTKLMFYSLTQMVSKGVVSMEELRRQLGEKLPGAMNIAANSLNTTMPQLEAAIRKGVVNSAKFLPIFAESVRATFGPGLNNATAAFDAEVNRLTNNLQKMVIVFYDLGVADAFTNIIKELNRILSDKKIAEEFAKALKDIADGVTKFLKTITADTVRKFIGDFTAALKLMAKTITEDVMPIMIKLADMIGKIAAAWLVVKGISMGAAAGTVIAGPGAGTIGGGIAGGVAAGAAVYGIHNALNGQKDDPRASSFLAERERRMREGGQMPGSNSVSGKIGGLMPNNAFDGLGEAWEGAVADSAAQNKRKGRKLDDVLEPKDELFKPKDHIRRQKEVIAALMQHDGKQDEYIKTWNPFHLSEKDKEKISSDVIKNIVELKADIDAKTVKFLEHPTMEDDVSPLNQEQGEKLKKFYDGMKLQTELEELSHRERISTVQTFTNDELSMYGDKYTLIEAMNQEHLAKMEVMEDQKHSATRQMEMRTAELAMGLLQTMAGKSKAAALAVILISKGLAIAQTVQATSVAVMRAFSDLGPIGGAAAAPGIKALGAIQIGLIAATGLMEAGNLGAGSATPTFNANPNTGLPVSGPGFQSSAGMASQTIINFTVEGNLVGNTEFVNDTLIPALRDAIDNRDVTIISSNSRQAAELAA